VSGILVAKLWSTACRCLLVAGAPPAVRVRGGMDADGAIRRIGPAKPQACVRISGAELKRLDMSVESGIVASPQTAGSSGAILGLSIP
jgi:hypothetical protein